MNILFQIYIPGIIASLIAAFIIWFIKYIITRIQERSDFNGAWKILIYDSNNQLMKEYVTEIKHNKKTHWIYGRAKRKFPQNDTSKKWKVLGLLFGKDIICLVWSTQSFVSLNCSYLHQTKNEGYEYEGLCLKKTNDKIEKYKTTLSKIEL
jgi:ABC-type transport system involved in Fe-S cluster assembly fused permease/ATPase subunit